jgi:hypothetical protein
MVIGNFDVPRSVTFPDEAHSVLIVDPDAVLPLPISGKSFQSIAGRHAQIVQTDSDIELVQLTQGGRLNAPPAATLPRLEEIGGIVVPEALDQSRPSL